MGNFGTRLEEYRKYKGFYTQEEFAQTFGKKQGNITSWIAGSVPSVSNLRKILEAHPDLNEKWLTDGIGPMLKTKDSITEEKQIVMEPTISYTKSYSKSQSLYKSSHKLAVLPMSALAGYAETVSDLEIEQSNLDYAVLPDYNHCDTIVEVDGDSMYPTFCSRDKVICKKLEDWDYIEAGKAYVINVKGQFVLKRVFENDDPKFVYLVSDNDKNYPKQRIQKDWIQGMFKVHGIISNNTGMRKIY